MAGDYKTTRPQSGGRLFYATYSLLMQVFRNETYTLPVSHLSHLGPSEIPPKNPSTVGIGSRPVRRRNALLLATFFGGLVSSLATIILFLRGSNGKKDGQENLYLAYLSASTGSLFKDIVILFAIVPQAFFQKMLLPTVSIFLVMITLTLLRFSKSTQTEEVRFTDRPLPFKFITKFSTVFSIVMILMVFVRFYLGHAWLIIATFLSSLISSAAALASIGEAFKYNEIGEVFMGSGILLALLGSITAKYGVILYHLGIRQSGRFLLPILYMVGVGGLAFYVTFF